MFISNMFGSYSAWKEFIYGRADLHEDQDLMLRQRLRRPESTGTTLWRLCTYKDMGLAGVLHRYYGRWLEWSNGRGCQIVDAVVITVEAPCDSQAHPTIVDEVLWSWLRLDATPRFQWVAGRKIISGGSIVEKLLQAMPVARLSRRQPTGSRQERWPIMYGKKYYRKINGD